MPTSVCPFNDYPPEKIEPLVGDDWIAAARRMLFNRQVRIGHVVEADREPFFGGGGENVRAGIDGKPYPVTACLSQIQLLDAIPSQGRDALE